MRWLYIGISAMVALMIASVKVKADLPSNALLVAQIQAESGGDDNAIGDKFLSQKAYGCLQIRQPCVDDYNRWHQTHYKAEDCLGNRELSVRIYKDYIDHYATAPRLGRTPTDEDKARIWNGGPVGCFEDGAIDKRGTLPDDPKKLAKIKLCQKNAKRYWLDKVHPMLK